MNNNRLKILSKSEINELYCLPKFSASEQKTYFDLNKKEYAIMSGRGSSASKIHFILQLGYLKATSQFFDDKFDAMRNDIEFIITKYLKDEKLNINAISSPSQKTCQSNQLLIAKELGYKIDISVITKQLQRMLESKIKLSGNPIYLFHEILNYSAQNKMMILSYSTLQDLIGKKITENEKILSKLLTQHLTHLDWKLIDAVLYKNNNDEYILSELKKDPKSFKTKQIKAEIKKIVEHESLYKIAKNVLPKLNITTQNIQYYAGLAMHYPINDLKKLTKVKQAIYLLCYAHHSHQKINDNLTMSFIYYIEKYKSESNLNAREKILDEKLEINDDVKNAALVFRFFDDDAIPNNESFGSIRKRAQKYVKKGKFNTVADYLLGLLFDFQEIKWDEIVKLKKKITANLRPIFRAIEFNGDANQKNLLLAISFLKNYFLSESTTVRKSKLKNVPIQCIPSHWKKHLMQENDINTIDMAKYEFMIYQLIVDQIEAGHIYMQNSISFKSLSSHLISDGKWQDKEKLLKELGNKKLLTPIDQLLNDFENTLEKLIIDVNKRIENGENTGIKIKREKKKNKKQKEGENGTEDEDITFTLPYPDTADKENNPIFKQLSQISIAEVLQFSQKNCNFMSALTHIKPYDAKDTLDPVAMMACIIANATNLGIYKMAQSSDLKYKRMYTQMKNFMRLETLRDANDCIVNAIADLPIFQYWNIHDDYKHGSVDGQKFETRLNVFIARYSSKYFGVSRGVSAYTLCANHIPVNTKIISANQHESHHLFDILYNVTSEIDIKWLSGDGHSINQVNFTLLDFIDKQFAPHFKRINKKSENLSGFKQLKMYKDFLIKPQHLVDKKLIKKEWDNVQRIIASLLSGETSQHLIVSKLSSHKRNNTTKDALWEYDKILMSIYLLKFIDDPVIRKNVRRALNRGYTLYIAIKIHMHIFLLYGHFTLFRLWYQSENYGTLILT